MARSMAPGSSRPSIPAGLYVRWRRSRATSSARSRANSPCRPRWGGVSSLCGGGGGDGGANEGATAPPSEDKERVRLLILLLLALLSASLRTAKIRVGKDWRERGGGAVLSTGTLFGTDLIQTPAIRYSCGRSFFFCSIIFRSIRQQKTEQKEIAELRPPARALLIQGIFHNPSTAIRHRIISRLIPMSELLRGSNPTLSSKYAQSRLRDDQIAPRAVASLPDRRQSDLTFGSWRVSQRLPWRDGMNASLAPQDPRQRSVHHNGAPCA